MLTANLKKLAASLLLTYFRLLAKLQLKKNPQARIIGVTGSTGKSTTHQAIYAVLKNHFKVKLSQKANSQSGIPLDILDLHPVNYTLLEWLTLVLLAPLHLLTHWQKFDIYLVEMGIDGPNEPNNMHYLLKIIQPHIGVFTNVTSSHAEYWDKLIKKQANNRVEKVKRLIAQEKGLILTQLPIEGFAIYNAADPLISQLENKIKAHKFRVSSQTQNSDDLIVRMITTPKQKSGVRFKYHQETVDLNFIQQPYIPKGLAVNFGLAVAVGLVLQLSLKQAALDLEKNWQPLAGRGRILKGIKDSLIIDASYNAQPDSVLMNLKILQQLPNRGRKLVILGDMRELGQSSQYWHEKVAQFAAKIADEMILVGPAMKQFFMPAAAATGFDPNRLHHFDNTYQAALFTKKEMRPHDAALVQASQNTLLFEIIVAQLLDKTLDQQDWLCRQHSSYWQKQRQRIINDG